jgi:hypothetical protein
MRFKSPSFRNITSTIMARTGIYDFEGQIGGFL